MASAPVPLRALDVGCGTGGMLVEFALRLQTAIEVVGVDPSPRMVERANERADGLAQVVRAAAEQLPFADQTFDLVVSTLSFDHWDDQSRGLREIARVTSPEGVFVLADLCGWWLPNRGRIRHRRKLIETVRSSGFELDRRETVYRISGLPLVQAFVFVR
jgi:SAM-dependent methyltransferase